MKLCMIGTGYVGLVSGVCFSDIGNTVICVDKDKNKIKDLNKGKIPIYEPGLNEILKKNFKEKRLTFTSNLRYAILKSDIIFICVGTPSKKGSNSADLKYVFKAADDIGKFIQKKKIVVTKSTVPVGTGDLIENIFRKKRKNKIVDVVSNPEFLREGEAIRDFIYPDRVIVGAHSSRANKILKSLYLPIVKKKSKFLTTSRRGAELIKYASNAFLATKISYINELANLCEKTNVDIKDISLGMGLDERIGERFLRAGPAYGGSCFPKDTKAILETSKKYKVNLSIIDAVIKSNDNRKKLLINKTSKILNHKFKNKTVCFLGVTFKPNTDDMREASSIPMIKHLSKKGAKIRYYDPTGYKHQLSNFKNVLNSDNLKSACKNCDLIIIHTEWNEFKQLNFKKLVGKNSFKVLDLRNIFSPSKMLKKGIKYFGIGR